MKLTLKKQTILSSVLVLYLFPCYGQNLKISGNILNKETREPVVFASIIVLDSFYGTVSDNMGTFTLTLPQSDSIIIKISSIGYESRLIKLPQFPYTIYLRPSVIKLHEVIVTGSTLEPKQIVNKAFKSISENYYKEPILLETFYRHYCQDDSIYGRVIEATIDIYKKRGYGRREKYETNKDMLTINELRRSFDNSQMGKVAHRPMAIELIQVSDIIALKANPSNDHKLLNLILDNENFINSKSNLFSYELLKTTTINDNEVFIIGFSIDEKISSKEKIDIEYKGNLYIATSNFALVRYETFAKALGRVLIQTVTYKKFGSKYALSHSVSEMKSSSKEGNTHEVHVELVVTNLIKGKQKQFNDFEITREYLATIPYRPEFWSDYVPVKTTFVPRKVAQDLQTVGSLEQQYEKVEQYESQYTLDVKKNEEKLLAKIVGNNGIMVIDLWAAWCSPCIRQFKASADIRRELSEKGVTFLMVSLDENWNLWRNVIELYEMGNESHLKIGSHSTFLRPLKMNGIPRYLVYNKQTLVNDNAPNPTTPAFKELIEGLLTENNN